MARQEDRTHFRGVRKPPGEAFPVVLGEALRRRGLTLAETREALAQRGQSISVATLSYWRAGRRVPEGPASLDVLDCLDEVLHLEPGTLRGSLGPSRRHGPATQEYVGLPSFVRPSEAATRALVDLGLEHAESAVAEEYVVVAVDVDVRGQETRAVVRSRLRALRDGVDRRPLVVDAGEPIAEPVTVVSAHGCRVGRTRLDLAVGLQVHELLLERPLALGETATVEYELRLADTAEPETEFVFHCARRVGEVEVWVRFDPRLVPAEAEVFVVDATGVERAWAVDMTGTRSIVSAVRHVGPGTVGARWTWPTVPGVLGVPERDAQDTAADAARTPLPPEPGVRPT